MTQRRVWDRQNQMPPGQEFEAYHFVDTAAQPVFYHSHPHYEIFFISTAAAASSWRGWIFAWASKANKLNDRN